MSQRRAIIVGNRGQDGQLLSERLRARGDAVVGVGRSSVDAVSPLPAVSPLMVQDAAAVADLVKSVQPDEIYYLAAHHASSEAAAADVSADVLASIDVNVRGVVHVLDAIRRHAPRCRLFFASSSLIFGDHPRESPQTESTPPSPLEPYALCKLLASTACQHSRQTHGVFASVGILYNHESRFRQPHFVSRKIVRAAVDARWGATQPLIIGDLGASIDWSDAGDFVDAFVRILALDEPGDFIIASGRTRTVREFLDIAFGHVGLDWQRHVIEDSSILSRRRSGIVGDSAKLRRMTGWSPKTSFDALVRRLVDEELEERARLEAGGGAA